MSSLKRAVIVATAAMTAAAMMSACSSGNKATSSDSSSGSSAGASAAASASTAALTTVRIGVTSQTAPPTMLSVVADSLGIAAAHHLKLDFVNISPDVAAQALATNRFDVLAAPAIEQAILQGGKFHVIAGAAAPYFSLWGQNGTVTDWASLKGKQVGIPAGQDSAATVLFEALLQKHGVKPSSVTLKFNSAVSNYQAMAAGAVQAGLSTPPYTYQLATGGKFTEIDPLSTDEKGYLSTEFTASDDFIDGNKAAVANFVQMLVDTEKVMTQSPIPQNVVDAVNANLQKNGTDPSKFDVAKFLAEMAKNGTWQIIPTKTLIEGDLSLLAQISSLANVAKGANFDTLVYTVPEMKSQYGQ